MGDWTGELSGWFALAEQQTAAALRLMGQDNEVVTLGVMALIGLVTLALVWGLALSLLRGILSLFGGGGEPRETIREFRGPGFAAPLAASGPGALDVVPRFSAGAAEPPVRDPRAREPRASLGAERQTPAVSASAAEEAPIKISRTGPSGGLARQRLAQAAGAASPESRSAATTPAGSLQQIQLKQLPHLADRGSVVSARPEWTGKVAPSSLQEAGAVEVCRVLSRRPSLAGSEAVRAVDYRVCGLPRVNGEGKRQPDVMVYTVADRGFLPKGPAPRKGRR